MEWIAEIGTSSLYSLSWLLGLGGGFAFLVWLTPCNPGMVAWRNIRSLSVDFLYWFLGPLLVRFGRTMLMAAGIVLLFGKESGWISPLRELPHWVQCVVILIFQDILLYWIHRLFHTRMAWDYHAVHHSPTVLDWMATTRSHAVNVLFSVVLVDVVVLLLGFSPEALVWLVPFNILYSSMVHANLNWTFGPLRYVFASPVFHRWHHTTEERGLDKNFASTFPILDVIFGTYYMPKGELPQVYGTGDPHFPEDFVGQFIHPFRVALRSRATGRLGWSARRGFAVGVAFVLGLLIMLSAVHGYRTSKRNDHASKAEDHFYEKDFERSIVESTRAIQEDPNCAIAFANRAAARLEKGELEGAIADSSRAIELDPKLAAAYANRAGARLNSGDLDGALADSKEAIKLDPGLALGYANRGGAYLNQGEFNRSIADCTQALALDPALTVAYFTRASAYLSLGQDDDSIRDYSEVLKRNPDLVTAYANRATAHLHSGRLKECIADYGEAIRRDRKLVLAYLNRGAALVRLGNALGAFQDFSDVIRLQPKLAIAYAYRGTVSLGLGNTKQVIEDCNKAIELDPQIAVAYWSRGAARAQLGERQLAEADQKKALELDPSLAQR